MVIIWIYTLEDFKWDKLLVNINSFSGRIDFL